MNPESFSFGASFSGPMITVYGNLVDGISFSATEATAAGLQPAGKPSGIARIRAFRVGPGPCVTLPIPSLLVVFGEGQPLTESECGLTPGEVFKWAYGFGEQVFALEPSRGAAEEVLEALAARGIDGGLNFENPRYENGKLCVDVHIWARINVLGASARFDERFPVCINIGQACVTVWDIGFANLQVCFRAPNQICGKLCVGKFGIGKCWEQCVSIPIGAQPTSLAAGVTCTSLVPYAIERADCVSVTIKNGKACLNVPIYGSVCVDVPDSVPTGTVAEACVDVCKKYGVPCGVKVYVNVAGQTVASQDWGCC